jgi:hypothetical protein
MYFTLPPYFIQNKSVPHKINSCPRPPEDETASPVGTFWDPLVCRVSCIWIRVRLRDTYCPQITSWSLWGVKVLSVVQVDGRFPIDQRWDVAIHSLTATIGHVHALFISFFEGRKFWRWIATNITSARGTLYCRKTRIPCGDRLGICGLCIANKRNIISSVGIQVTNMVVLCLQVANTVYAYYTLLRNVADS